MSEETREFERLYQKNLDRIYRELGYRDIQRIQGKENRYNDLSLTINGIKKKIEEKGLTYNHKDCPIELIQNIFPPSIGWFYETKADYIHFFYYKDKMPIILYQLSFNKLKKMLFKPKEKIPNLFIEKKAWPRLAIKYYGITINLCISWQYLKEKNCATVLKEWNKSIGQRDLFHHKLKEALNVSGKE